MTAPPTFPLTIVRSEELVPGFRRITFAPQPGLRYEAGQFITFVHTISGQELRRSYSLLSVPGLDAAPAIGVRRIDNGLFSRYLFDHATPGTVLRCTGAAGLFRLPPGSGPQQLFFLAAGSGITPIWALLRAVLHRHPQWSAVLVYSSHDPATAILRKELVELAKQFAGRFHLHPLYSTDPQLRRARLNRDGLLGLLRLEGAGPERTWFYCCGPDSYMRFCTFVLREAGIPAARIRREDFIPSPAPVPQLAPPDTAPQEVRLYWQGRGWRFTVRWPDSILRGAQHLGLELPYSCAAGRCASCVATCLEGRTWMARNEVLTAADLAHGLTLTCTAYPDRGPVTLRLDDTPTDAPLTDLGA
ncbi:MAG: iron-sulfur cluster-binding domain-containing protein [Chitinophagaceae bacterium]|nr:MAG: iron-sulfur cluster-binding domain-containing protein [Chitinophagaceae bacterium]